jgi:hypothetical protein
MTDSTYAAYSHDKNCNRKSRCAVLYPRDSLRSIAGVAASTTGQPRCSAGVVMPAGLNTAAMSLLLLTATVGSMLLLLG